MPAGTPRGFSSALSKSAPAFSLLYPILDAELETRESLAAGVASLGRAGCRLVQLRAKSLGAREALDWAALAVEAARRSGIAVIVNDRADVARLSGANGVHLGQDDLSVASARRVLGDEAIVGISTHTLEQARGATRLPVDYVAIGPVYATTTKHTADAPLGVEVIRRVRQVVDKPLVAIGGITIAKAPELIEAGVDGLAVISALKNATGEGRSLEAEARRWLSLRG